MDNKPINEYLELTGVELCFAGQLRNIQHLLMPQDPFQGFLVEEIALELSRAQKKLSDKKLIKNDKNGDWKLSPNLSDMVDLLGHPGGSIILQQEHITGESTTVYFHQKEGKWLDLEWIGDGLYNIRLITKKKDIKERILGTVDLDYSNEKTDLSTRIKYEHYFKAQEIAREKGAAACKAYLGEVGQKSNVGEKLAEDLADPITSGSMTEWHWKERAAHPKKGFAFIGGKDRLWLVRENSKENEWIDLNLTSVKVLLDEFLKLL